MKKNTFKQLLYSACILAFLCTVLHAQSTQEWVTRYNGAGNNLDVPRSIAVDGSGNTYVTGLSIGIGTGRDYVTIKYNSAGVQLWLAIYNGAANQDDIPVAIGLDAAGNIYVSGYSGGGSSSYDYATVKYNSSGIQQWVMRYDSGNGYDYAYAMVVDASGNVYVTGESVAANYDYATIKYNTAGVEQWAMRYNGSQNGTDRSNAIAVDGAGNVYVTGRSQWAGNDNDIVTLKFNSAGVQEWGQLYNGAANDWDEGQAITVDAAGNVYITGYSISGGTYSDYVTVKYNSSGAEQWSERYSATGSNSDRAYAIALDVSGNVFVTGRLFGTGTNWDYGTIKYNSAGARQWVASYDGPGGDVDIAYSLAVDISGNVYVAGNSDAILNTDFATVKYNPAGAQLWAARYNGPSNLGDQANAIVLDAAGNVYVTGASSGNVSSDDFATIKYSQSIGINITSSEIPNKFSLGQNYPNPFNPVTNIKMDIQRAGNVVLKVYNTLGEEVESLVNKHLSAGSYEVDWDASVYPSGVYYCRLSAQDYSDTKKMILIK
jgi:uncharacterized delta-60 repeat protein